MKIGEIVLGFAEKMEEIALASIPEVKEEIPKESVRKRKKYIKKEKDVKSNIS